MAPTLTIPEMALHMRRLVEGMILDGHLRPAWAEGHAPVRVGNELGWRFLGHVREDGSPIPLLSVDLAPDQEAVISSDQLFKSFDERTARDAPGQLESEFLFRKKGFPVRWNKKKDEEQWRIMEGWWPLDKAIQLVTLLAMERRAGNWNPNAYAKLVGLKKRTDGDEFRTRMLAVMDGVLDARENYAALCHFLENESFEEVSRALNVCVPAAVYVLQCASTKLVPAMQAA